MKKESDRNTYLLYKYSFLFGFIVTILVFLVMVTGLGAANEGTIDMIIGLLFGFSSLAFFLYLRKRFVCVKLDNEQFEILNSPLKGVYSWEEIDVIEEFQYFSDMIFRFKRKQDTSYIYSIYDLPEKQSVWQIVLNKSLKTEMRSLLKEKKKELNI